MIQCQELINYQTTMFVINLLFFVFPFCLEPEEAMLHSKSLFVRKLVGEMV
jgi:hypothetical protein